MKQKTKKSLSAWMYSLSLGLICALEIILPPAKAIEFPLAPERDPPKTTAAGGRRTKCSSRTYPIIQPYTPGNDNHIKTLSSLPELLIYLPKTDAQFLHFVLKQENGEPINIQKIPLIQTAGDNSECYGDYVLTINLPNTLNLETNQQYQWEIFLFTKTMLRDYHLNPLISQKYSDIQAYTDMLSSSDYNSIRKYANISNHTQGVVEKVTLAPEIKTQLSGNKDIVQQAQIYANQGIWRETLSLALTLRESQPEEWKELLTSVGLDKYVDKKFQ